MDSKKVVTGLLIGIAAGTVLSLLFTEKGSKIRKKWYKKGNNVAENLKEKFNEFVDQVGEKISEVRK